MPPLTLNRRKKVVKKVKKVKMVEHKIDLDTLLVAYKIGAISIYDIKRFIKLSK